MLTVKCPSCGSYNDESSAFCYYCKQELPTKDGKPRKKKAAPPSTNTGFIPTTTAKVKRSNRPGCLTLYAVFMFFIAGAIILQVINTVTGFYQAESLMSFYFVGPFAENNLPVLISQATNELSGLILPSIYALLALILGWGVFFQSRWARPLGMLVQLGMTALLCWMFYILITGYPINEQFVAVFFGLMAAIALSIYILVWFAEHHQLFIHHR